MLKRKKENNKGSKSQLIIVGSFFILLSISIVSVNLFTDYINKQKEKNLIKQYYETEEYVVDVPVIEELRYGKYYILEKEAPEGYILTEEKMAFEILEDGEIVKANMVNEKVVIEVPNTGLNDYFVLEIISGLLMISGIGVIIYAKKKNKK